MVMQGRWTLTGLGTIASGDFRGRRDFVGMSRDSLLGGVGRSSGVVWGWLWMGRLIWSNLTCECIGGASSVVRTEPSGMA